MNLYDLTTELRAVQNQIEDGGGELTPDLEASLDGLTLDLSVKAVSIAKWVLNIHADEKAVQTEVDRLTAKKRGRVALQKRLKDYIRESMIAVGHKKIEAPAVTVRVQKNPPSAEIVSAEDIPADYQIVIPATTKIDKKKLLTDLKAGKDIPGARLVSGENHLRIE